MRIYAAITVALAASFALVACSPESGGCEVPAGYTGSTAEYLNDHCDDDSHSSGYKHKSKKTKTRSGRK